MIMPCGDLGRFRKFGIKYLEGFHIGYDFDQPENTDLKCIDDNGIIVSIAFMNGFGSLNPSTKGFCLFVKFSKYYAIYGHIKTDLKEGQKVNQDDIIGKIASFYNGSDYLPHCHFGIWNDTTFPESPVGYLPDNNFKKWIDPIKFLKGLS
jgi:murein DD-endopeptidase MepM/ murein hydrolase activator NlpD